ncbi:uncharacterized protein TNCV_4129291 [Trichonephila clavipes]|nr:uncharacterized protein TNCV_4129291 [Trichonephila clavipes]
MVLLYGKCHRNKREAARLYAIEFPSRKHPSYYTIDRAVQRLYKTGSCHRLIPLSLATPSSLRIPSEDVLGYALAYPESSVRDISKACSYSKSTVWNILHTYGAYPYRPVLAQELMPGDQERRFDFSNFVLNTLDENPVFLNEVLWSDECQFSRQGTNNTQNTHFWSLENPHLIRPNRHQVRWTVNMWCGIWKSTSIGPKYFDGPLTSESYMEILSGPLADSLEDEIPLRGLSRMWNQHNGAPAHKSAQPCKFLAQIFDTRIIGYGGQQEWPPQSHDLSPLDFFL